MAYLLPTLSSVLGVKQSWPSRTIGSKLAFNGPGFFLRDGCNITQVARALLSLPNFPAIDGSMDGDAVLFDTDHPERSILRHVDLSAVAIVSSPSLAPVVRIDRDLVAGDYQMLAVLRIRS